MADRRQGAGRRTKLRTEPDRPRLGLSLGPCQQQRRMGLVPDYVPAGTTSLRAGGCGQTTPSTLPSGLSDRPNAAECGHRSSGPMIRNHSSAIRSTAGSACRCGSGPKGAARRHQRSPQSTIASRSPARLAEPARERSGRADRDRNRRPPALRNPQGGRRRRPLLADADLSSDDQSALNDPGPPDG